MSYRNLTALANFDLTFKTAKLSNGSRAWRNRNCYKSWAKLVTKIKVGDRVGVGYMYSACGQCEYCIKRKRNFVCF
nr:alcohol dehydrogenase catalytic domain-containing protein [Mycoplasmopsis bovis]